MSAQGIRPTSCPASSTIADTILDFLGQEEEGLQTKQNEVTKTIAQQVFWGLKEDNWWKQIIDGDLHYLGSDVFDCGKHGGDVEPGYLKGCRKAFEFATSDEWMMKNPTLEFYLKLHGIACAHFKGPENGTLMDASKTGMLRKTGARFEITDSSVFAIPNEERELIEIILTSEKPEDLEQAKEYKAAVLEQIKAINQYIAQRSKELGAKQPIAAIAEEKGVFMMTYQCRLSELEPLTKKLFANFDEQISKTQSPDKKIELIADLFWFLELVHPFQDGQGRTDLILLNKLLAQHGLNPAILEEPYVSSLWSLEAWVAYLKEGMARWQKEFCLLLK